MKTIASVDEYYGPQEVARRMDVSRSTVWRLVKRYQATQGREGLGPVTLVGKSPRLAATVVNKYLAGRTV